jgi:polyisoprenoid-binding protein YceI
MRFVFALALVLPLGAAEYTIDSRHSSASFAVRHMMVSNVRGQFSKVTGRILYDPAKVEASLVEASIDVSTIDTREPKRDADLKAEEFFDVAKYPEMRFRSTKVWKDGAGLKLAGELTLHGVTQPVVLAVEGPSPEVKHASGAMMIGVSGTTKISRKAFGLTWNRVLETGAVVVGDEVTVTIDVEALRK